MNRICVLSGLPEILSKETYAFVTLDADKIRMALTLGIACTGATDKGSYVIYYNDSDGIVCLFSRFCKSTKPVIMKDIPSAVKWMKKLNL